MRPLAFVARALYFGAKAPWMALSALLGATRRIARSVRLLVRFARGGDHLACPAGHANTLVGRWKCSCGFELLGHAFASCPSCGEEAGWFPCRVCGLGIQDPLQR